MQRNRILPPEASAVSVPPSMAKSPALTTTNRNSFAAARPRPGLYHPILQSLELQRTRPPTTGLHPVVVIALSVVAWFLAVMWLNFTGGPKVGLIPVIVTGIFVMFFTLVLLAATRIVNDPRWRRPKSSLSTRMMRGSLSCSALHCCR
jgi:hypothetical protein